MEPVHEKKDIHTPQIALWGPQSAGKSWLLYAFMKRVKMLNDDLRRGLGGRDFRITISAGDKDIGRNADEAEFPSPTQDIQSKTILFRKQMMPSDASFSSSLLHRVNSHFHTIRVMDNQGQMIVPDDTRKNFLVGEGGEKVNKMSKEDRKKIDAAQDIVTKSSNIIVVLDSNRESTLDLSEKLDRFVQDRIFYSDRKYNIAFCLTKVDQLGILDIQNAADEDVESYLIGQLGKVESDVILDMVKSLKTYGHDARLFATSACGYLYDSREQNRRPNLAPDGSIGEISQWKPEGVEKPFFWLLEKTERNRLEQIGQHGNKLEQFLWKLPFRSDRIKYYKSYDDILRYAQLGEQGRR